MVQTPVLQSACGTAFWTKHLFTISENISVLLCLLEWISKVYKQNQIQKKKHIYMDLLQFTLQAGLPDRKNLEVLSRTRDGSLTEQPNSFPAAASALVFNSQSGLKETSWGEVTYLICADVPPDVALVMAHAASFLVRNSAFWRISISTGKMLASITFWWEGGELRVRKKCWPSSCS